MQDGRHTRRLSSRKKSRIIVLTPQPAATDLSPFAMRRYRTTLLTMLLLGGLGLLFWKKTMAAQQVTCEVCINFNGARQCAKASGTSDKEAARTAHSTACGPVSNGMNEKIACDRRPPEQARCTTSAP